MNLNMNQGLGVVALGLGVFLLVVAYQASDAPMDQLSNTLTGRYTDQTMWYMMLGIAAAVTGGVLVLSGIRKS